jgi:hypothetical protein
VGLYSARISIFTGRDARDLALSFSITLEIIAKAAICKPGRVLIGD